MSSTITEYPSVKDIISLLITIDPNLDNWDDESVYDAIGKEWDHKFANDPYWFDEDCGEEIKDELRWEVYDFLGIDY
mgnify:CR=1 FL=1|tara:strand:+ start:313 stop:543 length:231 start_codon:yes stop_codon:yes gene_type:complete